MTPIESAGPSRCTASLAIFFSQTLPSCISQPCMISTRPPLPWTLSDLMSQSTGNAFSTGVSCQPPAPKPFGPPIMMRPEPWSSVLLRMRSCCSSVTSSSGTSARMTQSKPRRKFCSASPL